MKIWNPWHGCLKCSEGCKNCYMYYLDSQRGNDGSKIYKVKNPANNPLGRDKNGYYKIKSGETIHVCLTSDFFLEEILKEWREECFNIMNERSDVAFILTTKRPQNIKDMLPTWWNMPENIMLLVTCENQKRADERIPILFNLPFKHKGIICEPLLEKINIEKYLKENIIEQVLCGGENYGGARECNYDWIKSLSTQCKEYNTNFCVFETGTVFIKDGKTQIIEDKEIQSKTALSLNLNYEYKPINFIFKDSWGFEIPKEELFKPIFKDKCNSCGSKTICSGCTSCGKCK